MITKEQIELIDRCGPEGLREEALDELCRLALLGLSMQWQPIETAPNDGTRIVLALESGSARSVTTAYWDRDVWECGDACLSDVPTHWMPLPGAPR